ncbi:MAG: exonuclease SbcCD subunit D [Jatrophihabitantaceae bacterium]
MRLLHTSDWHLGRALHGEPMLEHQRAFLRWLVDQAVARQVDAVLVAGDVYDRAVPPTDAVALLDETLACFAAADVGVVITSGNHDSAIRLGFGGALAERAGVHLRTDLDALHRPVVLEDLAIYGVPYLLPDAVMAELGADRSHASVLAAALDRIRADAAARGLAKIVVLAHAFVTGAAGSESERDIRVGGISDVPAEVFAGVTYAALGHLHGAQQVAPNVRYSGSPMPFSFSERHHHKSVAQVDVAGDGSVAVELVPAPVTRPMAEVRGRLDELLAAAEGPPCDAWVRAVLTDARRPSAPMERLRERWPHTLVLDFQPEAVPVAPATDLARLRRQSDPVEICALFVEWVDSTLPDRHQRDALASAVEAVRAAETA